MTPDPIIERLDRLIQLQADALDDRRLWSADDVGRYLGKSARFVLERAACRPDFPASIRIMGGHRRWEPAEVKTWARRQRSGQTSHRRKPSDDRTRETHAIPPKAVAEPQ